MPGDEEEAEGAAELYRTLLAHLPDMAVFLFDEDLRIVFAEGDLWRRVPWLHAGLYVGRLLEDLRGEVPDAVLDRLLAEHRATLADGRRRDFTVPAASFTFEISSTLVEGPGGTRRVAEVVRDVSAAHELAAERARAAELHKILAGSIPGTGVGLVGEDLRWRSLEGEEVLASLGVRREQVVGNVVGAVHGTLGGVARPFIEEALRGVGGSFTWSSPAGSTFDVQVVPVGDAGDRLAMVCVTDVTRLRALEEERRRLEQRLAQQQRLDSLGLLAGGVAHDFNNMLAIVLSYAEALEDQLDGQPAAADATAIVDATKRAAELTQRLLVFARGEASSPRQLDVDELVTGVVGMLERTLGSGTSVATDLRAGGRRIVADPAQLEQVVVNLVLNARDATPGGGEVALASRVVEVEAEGAPGGVPAGRYVSLTVEDRGEGMPEEVLQHAFDPFFTTKGGSGGTGLGLSTSYGAVARAGGTIRLRSEVGRGTTAEVLLPVAGDAEPSQGARLAPAVAAAPPGGAADRRPRVLLADDEAHLRRLLALALEADGLEVVACGSAEEAVAELERRPVDLLVTDVVMPGASGTELVRRVLATTPDLPVVFITGFAPAPEELPAGAPVLRKPFGRAELVAAVREQLKRRAAG